MKPLTIITGHYGVGKTTLALRLARDLAAAGEGVTLIDLDVVNPYFRSSDYANDLEAAGVEIVGPTFANTTLDNPSLPATIDAAIARASATHHVIIDVGGDDAGATTLGRYHDAIIKHDYDLLYVVNERRNLTQTPAEAIAVLREIEAASGLKATGIVSNTHLQDETTPEIIAQGEVFADEIAHMTDLPLVSLLTAP